MAASFRNFALSPSVAVPAAYFVAKAASSSAGFMRPLPPVRTLGMAPTNAPRLILPPPSDIDASMDPALQHDVRFTLVREVIARGQEVPLKTSGLSMGHTVHHGEWILVQQTDPEQIRTGDIVLYQIPATFVAHRVIRRWRDHGECFFLTKGDGHFASDSPLHGTDIIARVLGVRRGERVLRFDSPQGRVLATLLLWHSLAVWRLYRVFNRTPRLSTHPSTSTRWVRRVLFLPQGLLIRLWNRTAHR